MCDKFDITIFIEKMIEAIAWTEYVLDNYENTIPLWETLTLSSPSLSKLQSNSFENLSELERRLCVTQVFQIRSDLIEQQKIDLSVIQSELTDRIYASELMVFFPTESFVDGTANVITSGYFSYDNLPPCSTWIAYLGENDVSLPKLAHLICWIPPSITDTVLNGIEMSPDKSLSLLRDSKFNACYKPLLKARKLM